MLVFYTGTESDVRRATLDGKVLLDVGTETSTDAKPGVEAGATAGAAANVGAGGGLRVSFAAPPPQGIELLIETRASAIFRLVVQDLSFGLPEVAGQTFRPRPAHTMPAPAFRTSDTTIVRKSFALAPRKE